MASVAKLIYGFPAIYHTIHNFYLFIYKGVLSDAKPVIHGVPQGSVLGPILCLLYIKKT